MRRIVVRTSFLWLSSVGCVVGQPPYEEYSIARTAYRAARDYDSPRFSPANWIKAEEAFRNGEKAFHENEFKDARKYFRAAKEYSEAAENATRLKKFKTGDAPP